MVLHLQVAPSHSGNAQNSKVQMSEPLPPVVGATVFTESNLLH